MPAIAARGGMADKIDLKKRYRTLFAAQAAPALIDVPALPYLMVDGAEAPGGGGFAGAVAALYATAYAIKFAIKKAGSDPDYGVAPLEALWWSADGRPVDPSARPAAVRWKAMVMQPDFVDRRRVDAGIAAARAKLAKKNAPANAALDRIVLERLAEGRAAQLLHVGPYAEEGADIERLHAFIAQQRLAPRGRHHEIYLNDPARTAPEKLKTILRQPVG